MLGAIGIPALLFFIMLLHDPAKSPVAGASEIAVGLKPGETSAGGGERKTSRR